MPPAMTTLLGGASERKATAPFGYGSVSDRKGSGAEGVSQDDLYQEAADTYGSALDRLARAYEADPDTPRDLLQDIHLQLWRSFGHFDVRCCPRTLVVPCC